MSTRLPEGTNKLINKYLIKVDGLFKKKYLNGKEIYIDNSYNELQNAQSVGEVVALPMKKSLQDPNINVGDSVLLHHFATAKNKVIKIGNDKEVYIATEASMMYMAIDKNNSCKAIGPFCILEKEEEKEIHTESGIFTGEVEEKDNNEGVVVAADESFINHGGSLGDNVVFDKGVDYDMQMPDGKMYYRVRTSSIYAIVNG